MGERVGSGGGRDNGWWRGERERGGRVKERKGW